MRDVVKELRSSPNTRRRRNPSIVDILLLDIVLRCSSTNSASDASLSASSLALLRSWLVQNSSNLDIFALCVLVS